tara:strand:+ start:145 stop:519 length:375 start_codon:yes stop_codon:yes gene_type:complete
MSELRVLTINYSSGHTENILFSISDIKQAAAILEELPSLVEYAESAGSWDIITITDSRLEELLCNDGVDWKNDQILIEKQRGEIEKLTKQLEAANQIIEDRERSISEWTKAGNLVGLTRKAGQS